jgi:DNA-directed RNA polymerase subunit M/transcription elongation factor TFIIS
MSKVLKTSKLSKILDEDSEEDNDFLNEESGDDVEIYDEEENDDEGSNEEEQSEEDETDEDDEDVKEEVEDILSEEEINEVESEIDDVDYEENIDSGSTFTSKKDSKDFSNIARKILEKRMTGNQSKVSKTTKKKYKKEDNEISDYNYTLWTDFKKEIFNIVSSLNIKNKKINKKDAIILTDLINLKENDEKKISILYLIFGYSLEDRSLDEIINDLNIDEYDSKVYKEAQLEDEKETRNMIEKPIIKDGYPCRNKKIKCKSTKTVTELIQTRSSDEPMTEFSICTKCGFRWRN